MPPPLTALRRSWRGACTIALLLHVSVAAAAPARPTPEPLDSKNAELASILDDWAHGRGGVVVLDSLLADRLAHLRAEAPSFERAWASLHLEGVPVLIGTHEQLALVLPTNIRASNGWAGITVSWDDRGGRLERSAVAIRTSWLKGLHEQFQTPDGAFEESIDELLIHEVYGHLVPVVSAGTAQIRCADPRPEQRLEDSCVGRRELALRAERTHGRAELRLARQ